MLELSDCTFFGHALPEPFVKLELEGRLAKEGLLPKATGAEGRQLEEEWETYRRALRSLGSSGGPTHVVNHVISPLRESLGYLALSREELVETREGEEDGGWLLNGTAGGAHLRAFAFDLGADLDAPARRGHAYRFSPGRIAHRVLLARNEPAALLTNGVQLRFLLCDPTRPESHIAFRLDRGSGGWAARPRVPDSFRLLRSLASPAGLALLPDLTEAARLNQTTVTKNLRKQARAAVEGFVQEVLDHPENAAALSSHGGPALAKELWREGLVLMYRLLFTLKLEASADPARAFSFASTSLWRRTFSPNAALGPVARSVLSEGADTGSLLEDGLRTLFRLFAKGVSSSELRISPLGGALFGEGTTPLLDSFRWGERAVARLLVNLLWTAGKEGEQRVHYGTLDVEDLGRVYESLLELEPGIAPEPMCRLRRQKLEVVVPLAQGEAYREKADPVMEADGTDEGEDGDATGDEGETPRGKKTKVDWIEAIPPGRFFLRVGLGRKSTGAYYTPHPFVRFLVQETLGPQAAERSPAHEPDPGALLTLSVLDPAMGSGHFLVEACRFLGEKLYEACRLCDELALAAEEAAAKATTSEAQAPHEARAAELRHRVEALPDPDDLMVAYLPSRVAEGESAGLSQTKALALARRLVAVHCLYGVDKNPLAVELAKLALWLESYSEGLPLTFLDHRLVCGDSLTGPFFENLLTYPGSGQPITGLFAEGLTDRLKATLQDALVHVRELEATVGKDVSDLEAKSRAKERLDVALAPFRPLAAAWSGGVMLGREGCDDAAYEELLRVVAERSDPETVIAGSAALAAMIEGGREAAPYDLTFPEVFHPDGTAAIRGFDVVLGNPPWERIEIDPEEFFSRYDLSVLSAPDSRSRQALIDHLQAVPEVREAWRLDRKQTEQADRVHGRLFQHQQSTIGTKKTLGRPDTYRLFVERFYQLARDAGGQIGWIVPSSFHSNEGATGVRRLYLEHSRVRWCFSFENQGRLFEIHSSQKFVLLVTARDERGTSVFPAAFYLRDPSFLFAESRANRLLSVSVSDLALASGSHLAFIEARSQLEFDLALALVRAKHTSFEGWTAAHGIVTAFGVEVHRNPEFGHRFLNSLPTESRFREAESEGWHRFPIHEGKSIHQFTDQFDSPPEKYVSCEDAIRSRHWSASVPSYRLAFRMKASSTNERSMIAVFLTHGFVCEQTLAVETRPLERANCWGLTSVALLNSFLFDWQTRQRITTSLSNYLLAPIPVPDLTPFGGLIVHSALRLTCNHAGYAPLWQEQVGDAWREARPSLSWPVLEGDDSRWAVRAGIDAVVAAAYELTREHYAHVLSTFSHKSYQKAPTLCLAAFDELKAIGIDEFICRHDPYWDIPINEDLPTALIDIPVELDGKDQLDLEMGDKPRKASRAGRRRRAPG